MPRPGYLNVYVNEPRKAWLNELCERLRLEPNHKNHLTVIDAALAAMVAELTKGEDVMMDARQFAQDLYDAQQVTVDEYPSVDAYVEDMMDLLKEENWGEDVDLDDVRKYLTYIASA